MTKECYICYEKINCLQLYCKHFFCYNCIEKWYLKKTDNVTCPFCRKNIYFKNFCKIKNIWNIKKTKENIQYLYNIYFNCFVTDLCIDLLIELDKLFYNHIHKWNFTYLSYNQIQNLIEYKIKYVYYDYNVFLFIKPVKFSLKHKFTRFLKTFM